MDAPGDAEAKGRDVTTTSSGTSPEMERPGLLEVTVEEPGSHGPDPEATVEESPELEVTAETGPEAGPGDAVVADEGDGDTAARRVPARARPQEGAFSIIGDGVSTRESYAVTLDTFEGPLDLLLHLVRRHELDVLDLPISFITEKYVEYLNFARSLDIEIAGEYLVMAATLAYLKSRELLPPDPTEDAEDPVHDEEGDARADLIARLLEYERFRMASEDLGARPVIGRDVFGRGGELDVTPPPPDLAPVTLFRLADAYHRVLERARISQSHQVEIEPVTVRQRMVQLSLILAEKDQVDFEGLFLDRTWSSARELRQMLVVTLMSVLELVKLGVLGIHQAVGSESIMLERTGDAEKLSAAVQAFEEEPPVVEG